MGSHAAIAAGNALCYTCSAHSRAKVSLLPAAPLGFRSAVSLAVDFGVYVEVDAGSGAGATTVERPTEHVTAAACGGAALAAPLRPSKQAWAERAGADADAAQVADRQRTLTRATRRIALLNRDYELIRRNYAGLGIEAEQNPEFAYSAAHELGDRSVTMP
jgi:hypothetical protein